MSEPKQRVYLDHAAATPLSSVARRAMENAQSEYGNPSSMHEEGRRAHALLDAARSDVAQVVGASAEEIIFTASGSESDALALLGAARAYRAFGSHIVVSAIEHKAIFKTVHLLKSEGFSVSYVMPGKDGRITPELLVPHLREDTILVSIMYANNEIGTVQPISELTKAIHSARAGRPVPLFHSDACQAPGLLPVQVDELGVDLMSINSGKVYGPKGIAALYVRRGVSLQPIVGGEQEHGLRGGTENVVLMVGFAAAIKEAEVMRAGESARLKVLRELCFAEIEKNIPGSSVNGHRIERLPNNVHVSFPGVEGESILLLLDAAGIACATGSACNSFDLAPSHVLLAIGEEAGLSHGSIRLTLGRSTSEEDIRYAVQELTKAVSRLRSVSALTTRITI